MKQETKDLVCPSGIPVTIRETTGADDELFAGANANDADILNRYVGAVVIKGPKGGPFGEEEAKALWLRDKYFILIASRVFSLSGMLIFQHTWDEVFPPEEYEIDLEDFIWDYSKPFPEQGDENYHDQRIEPYKPTSEGWIEFTAGDYELRFHVLDGVGESILLSIPVEKRNINSQFKARNLQVRQGATWANVVNFREFSGKQMVTIRNIVEEYDADTQGLVTIINGRTFEKRTISILEIVDFFFPTKI